MASVPLILKFVSWGAGTSYELRKRDAAAGGGVTNVDEWRSQAQGSQAQAGGGCRCRGAAVLAARHRHRPDCPHFSIPAVSHSIRLDDGDAAGRRFAVRVEILLRLQPLFGAVFSAPVLGPHLRLAAQAGRYRGLPVTAR